MPDRAVVQSPGGGVAPRSAAPPEGGGFAATVRVIADLLASQAPGGVGWGTRVKHFRQLVEDLRRGAEPVGDTDLAPAAVREEWSTVEGHWPGDGRPPYTHDTGTIGMIGVDNPTTVHSGLWGAAIWIDGSPAFVQGVRADLGLLRVSPTGQRMLAALDRLRQLDASPGAGDPAGLLVIVEGDRAEASRTSLELADHRRYLLYTVGYHPARRTAAGHAPPIVGLLHEPAHVYGFMRGQAVEGRHDDPEDPDRVTGPHGHQVGAPNDERVAVGLPIDHDRDPATPHQVHPDHPDHPYELTENALRDEFGLPKRRRYGH